MPKSNKRFKIKSFKELSPKVQNLIGSGNISKETENDTNGKIAYNEHLEKKYSND